MSFIYLDYNATTPIDPRVAEAMGPFLSGAFGNPSSSHAEGRRAKAALEGARTQVAAGLGCVPREVIFTSGGSEANNLAIRGLVEARGGGHVITSAVEHPAVVEVVLALEMEGRIALSIVGVDRRGRVDPAAVAGVMRDDTVLVSLMLANNEVGTLQPVREVAALCRERGVACHTDAAQAVGKVPVDVNELGVDLLSVAGHKLYAPKGVGALFIRNGLEIAPQIRGAGHERGLRAGTESVLLAAGLGAACELARREVAAESERLSGLRDRLAARLRDGCPDLVEHGDPERRLPNTLSVAFPGAEAGTLLDSLADELAASAGAACHAGAATVSHVLQAMGVAPEIAAATVRLSVGRFTTTDEIDRAAGL
ncbi:MAG TPA: cysteine desulfurase family protein, partial [Chondromyces sp.]|nr:cysteine desulfurase family protein [Chondromyces sp.]